MITFVPVIN